MHVTSLQGFASQEEEQSHVMSRSQPVARNLLEKTRVAQGSNINQEAKTMLGDPIREKNAHGTPRSDLRPSPRLVHPHRPWRPRPLGNTEKDLGQRQHYDDFYLHIDQKSDKSSSTEAVHSWTNSHARLSGVFRPLNAEPGLYNDRISLQFDFPSAPF